MRAVTALEVEERRAGGRLPQRHVLRHRERRHEHEVLVDHADAGLMASAGERSIEPSSVDDDLPLVRLVQPVELPHESALARPVLPEQGMHLPGLHVEADLRVGPHAGEALDDVPHLDVREECVGRCSGISVMRNLRKSRGQGRRASARRRALRT